MNNRGQTTVMFSLIISVLMLFTFSALEVGRLHLSTVKIEACVHSMRSSIMADYNKELFERYHLLFMDPTYGTGSEAVIEEKMKDYLETSLNGENGNSLYALEVEEVAVSDKETILSNNMRMLKKQIADYEKTAGVVNKVKELAKDLAGKESDVKGALQETEMNATELDIQSDSDEKTDNTVDSEEEATDEVDDPRETLDNLLKTGILAYVAPDKTYSKSTYKLNDLSSQGYHEEIQENGDDSFQDIDVLKNFLSASVEKDSVNALTKHTAFAGYVIDHFSNGYNSLANSVMKCEVEYILKGKDSDYENMEAVVTEMTWLRMPINYVYLLSDVGKESEALTLATGICLATGTEAFIEIVKYLLLACWAYGESLYEMNVLLSGGEIPYVKTYETWYTDLETLSSADMKEKVSVGLSYEDYLVILLAKKSGSSLNIGYARILDVIEMNLRNSYSNFRITDCVGAMTIQGKVTVNPMFYNSGQREIYDYYFEEKLTYEE